MLCAKCKQMPPNADCVQSITVKANLLTDGGILKQDQSVGCLTSCQFFQSPTAAKPGAFSFLRVAHYAAPSGDQFTLLASR